MKKIIPLLVVLSSCLALKAQQIPYSQQMAATAMRLWKDSLPGKNWSYDQGIVLQGLQSVWRQSANGDYFSYIQHGLDKYIAADGTIRTYKADDYALDNILSGRSVMTLFNVLNTEKYYKAATLLRRQLSKQPITSEGGFWHKKRYPNQMWLDGLYMAEPFYAEYATAFHEEADFDTIASQFILMEKHARDPKTGLLYHAWDESKKEKWANPETGRSATLWGRSVGWYIMGLVDVLDHFPANHPQRKQLLDILSRLATALQACQDKNTGVWYQVLDKAGQPGNYPEASASCMFVYAMAKSVREGYLSVEYQAVAEKGYQGILKQFVQTDAAGQMSLTNICGAVGLGGTPYRDGSYEYYTSVKAVTNDPKGVGPFMLASVEMERLANLNMAKGRVVLLDSYFNDEHRQDITGKTISYHYKWDEYTSNGFSFFGQVFNNYGLKTETLFEAPDADNLKKASVYIIVDPDIPKENPQTKYVLGPHIRTIADWVKKGGVLIVLNNDTGNAEFVHINQLMAKFGIHFNENSINHVSGKHFEQGAININQDNTLFKTARMIYIKELCTLNVVAPAIAALLKDQDIIVTTAKYGKGAVFAAGDPWFYNEYTDGRKLPPQYDNFKAANDVVQWVLQQLPSK